MTSKADAYERWIRQFHPSSDSGVRLICLPHAGGSASGYFSLSAALRPSMETWSVQYPGRQDRRHEPLIADVRGLAEGLVRALQGRLDRPYALFGHSMGAVVAFEVARLMESGAGPAPRALVVSGRRGPSTDRHEQVHLRDDAGVAAELRLLSGTNTAFLKDPELFEMILPALRADYRAVETYQCGSDAVVRCPVTVLVGDSDPRTTIDEARAWSRHTSGEFDVRIFPGGHFFLDECTTEVVNTLSDVMLSVHADGDGDPAPLRTVSGDAPERAGS